MKKILLVLIASCMFPGGIFCKENAGGRSLNTDSKAALESGCPPATAMVDLDINNVRARILHGGDMWWDLIGSAQYEVPAGSGKNSLFAGSLWIGGIDAGNQLKTAVQTYRQTGNDFWPGPLSSTGTVDASTCGNYDKFWKLNRTDVLAYHNWVINGQVGPNPVSSSVNLTINSWPWIDQEGNPLAPYHDYNLDGIYNHQSGDYPDFNLSNSQNCSNQLNGQQNIWWVINDQGNTHTSSGGTAIGLEIQAQAFAFVSNDDINNITFYKYKMINKSNYILNNTYIGQWVDADLGSYSDDYVGCDVERGLGYCYNGTPNDAIYGTNPPAIGIDFLQGPFKDPDGSDNAASDAPSSFSNYGDGITDNEHLGMSKFVYYNNDATVYGNPTSAINYYNYLKGLWKDNTSIRYGGNGHSGTVPCGYMFPGNTDPVGWGVGGSTLSPNPQALWSEGSVPNPVGDRRFIQSSGPFTLYPGAVNYITIAAVWARAASGGPSASVAAMQNADDMAQALFNNCFNITTDITEKEIKDLNISLYPNPFYNKAILTFKSNENVKYILSIYDLQGKLMRSYRDINTSVTICKDDLKAGTYIYSLSGSDGINSSGKFIIR